MIAINRFLTDTATIWGFVGFIATLVGLYFTFEQARQAKATSEKARASSELARAAAEEATKRVKKGFAKVDTAYTLNATVVLINRIYESQSRKEWERVPEFYKDVRQLLAETLGEASALSADDKKYVQAATSEFASIEKSIQRRSFKDEPIDDAEEINGIVTKHLNQFITMRTDIGRRE